MDQETTAKPKIQVFVTGIPKFSTGRARGMGDSLADSPTIAAMCAWTRKSFVVGDNVGSYAQLVYTKLKDLSLDSGSKDWLGPDRISFPASFGNDILKTGAEAKAENRPYTVYQNAIDGGASIEGAGYSVSFLDGVGRNLEQFSNSNIKNYWINMVYEDRKYFRKEMKTTIARFLWAVESISRYSPDKDFNRVEINHIMLTPSILSGKIKMLHSDECHDYNLEDYLMDEVPDTLIFKTNYILLSSRYDAAIHNQALSHKTAKEEHDLEISKKEGIGIEMLTANEFAIRAMMLCMRDGFRAAQNKFSPYTIGEKIPFWNSEKGVDSPVNAL